MVAISRKAPNMQLTTRSIGLSKLSCSVRERSVVSWLRFGQLSCMGNVELGNMGYLHSFSVQGATRGLGVVLLKRFYTPCAISLATPLFQGGNGVGGDFGGRHGRDDGNLVHDGGGANLAFVGLGPLRRWSNEKQ